MQKVAQRKGDRAVVTVILSKEGFEVCKNYHCHNCGQIVLNFFSDVRMIIDGELREVERPLDVYCKKCGLVHRFV